MMVIFSYPSFIVVEVMGFDSCMAVILLLPLSLRETERTKTFTLSSYTSY